MESIDELVLIGGAPALDLVNTALRGTPVAGHRNHDYLQTAGDLVTWSRRVGLISSDEARSVTQRYDTTPAAAAKALRSVQTIREALHVALLAIIDGRSDDDSLAEPLNALRQSWIRAVQRSELDLAAPDRLRVGTEPDHVVVDRIAVAAVETLREIDPQKLRRCPVEEGGCGWLFVDRSRNGSRRWCRMADCGTQVKSRRLTERRRQNTTAPARRPTTTH